jgi:hypothetical protein
MEIRETAWLLASAILTRWAAESLEKAESTILRVQ